MNLSMTVSNVYYVFWKQKIESQESYQGLLNLKIGNIKICATVLGYLPVCCYYAFV